MVILLQIPPWVVGVHVDVISICIYKGCSEDFKIHHNMPCVCVRRFWVDLSLARLTWRLYGWRYVSRHVMYFTHHIYMNVSQRCSDTTSLDEDASFEHWKPFLASIQIFCQIETNHNLFDLTTKTTKRWNRNFSYKEWTSTYYFTCTSNIGLLPPYIIPLKIREKILYGCPIIWKMIHTS